MRTPSRVHDPLRRTRTCIADVHRECPRARASLMATCTCIADVQRCIRRAPRALTVRHLRAHAQLCANTQRRVWLRRCICKDAYAYVRARTGAYAHCHHIACGAEECIDSPGAREAHVMCIVHRQRDAQVRGCAIRAVHASGCAMRDA
jgi:hypothetical protein